MVVYSEHPFGTDGGTNRGSDERSTAVMNGIEGLNVKEMGKKCIQNGRRQKATYFNPFAPPCGTQQNTPVLVYLNSRRWLVNTALYRRLT